MKKQKNIFIYLINVNLINVDLINVDLINVDLLIFFYQKLSFIFLSKMDKNNEI